MSHSSENDILDQFETHAIVRSRFRLSWYSGVSHLILLGVIIWTVCRVFVPSVPPLREEFEWFWGIWLIVNILMIIDIHNNLWVILVKNDGIEFVHAYLNMKKYIPFSDIKSHRLKKMSDFSEFLEITDTKGKTHTIRSEFYANFTELKEAFRNFHIGI